MEWILKDTRMDSESVPTLGNKFLVGNGYLGVRGTLDEYEADKLPAINLAGVYDKVGEGWREPVNAPNGCYTLLEADGEILRIPEVSPTSHNVALDIRKGIFSRQTVWHTSRGNITLKTERIASQVKKNIIGIRISLSADFHADLVLYTGIDSGVWDLNGKHLERLTFGEKNSDIYVSGQTHEQGVCVVTFEGIKTDYSAEITQVTKGEKLLHKISIVTRPGEEYKTEKFVAVYTDKDCDDPVKEAKIAIGKCKEAGIDKLFDEHIKAWEDLWKKSEIIIEGDDAAMLALNYSIYHLQSIAPRHSKSMSIPARGLSGQTYKGAIFWDTEMFMLDFFLLTDPAAAKTLMRYRIDTLKGAIAKAKSYGYEGAFYAWESQEGGFDACSDYNVTDVFTKRPMRTYFKDKQVHISSAIVYGILRYVEFTGDKSVLDQSGIRTIVECANFYRSLLLKPALKERYEIRDVIGPDEYHERVNNNGYTNRMAKFVFESAARVLSEAEREGNVPEEYNAASLVSVFLDLAEKIYIPEAVKAGEYAGVIPQFDGYFDNEEVSIDEVRSRLLDPKEYWGGAYGVASHTRIIKQADVVTWLNIFSDEFDEEILRKNWEFYEPRTEHGSSLSAGMYAMLACKIGRPDLAYPFFIKSASADLNGGGKEWAGLVYIGGTHPAAAGAAYMTAVWGFAGLSIKNGKLVCKPSLPSSIKNMKFRITYCGNEYQICVDKENGKITKL